MMRTFLIALSIAIVAAVTSHAAESGDAETTKRLGESKHTLIEAIHQAEKTNGTAISAKFEYEDGKLWLGVYAARGGRQADAEHNTLTELKGEPNMAAWKPETEVFEDKEHLTRSAMQLTLMQLSKLSLADIVTKAAASQTGTPYSAIPAVHDGKPVVVVLFAMPNGKTAAVNVELH